MCNVAVQAAAEGGTGGVYLPGCRLDVINDWGQWAHHVAITQIFLPDTEDGKQAGKVYARYEIMLFKTPAVLIKPFHCNG